jgi:microcystin-dependent protein
MSVKINGTTGIDLVQENALPFLVGQVCFFGMSSAPAGFLKANGAVVSRSTYAALFAAIGTTYGAGDGSTTFALPDLRGEFLRGWSDGRAVDSGRTFGSAQSDDFKSHTHAQYFTSAAGQVAAGGGIGAPISGPTGATGGAETRPRNVALLACIKF